MAEKGPTPDHLKPYLWKRGQSGNPGGQPGWKKQISEVLGVDGRELFQLQYDIAMARAIPVTVRQGKKLKAFKRVLGEGKGKKARQMYIVPTQSVMLQAQQALLDRAYGKAVQAIQFDDVSDTVGARVLPELTEAEEAVLMKIAHRRLLRASRGARGQHEEIDVTPDPADPQEPEGGEQ